MLVIPTILFGLLQFIAYAQQNLKAIRWDNNIRVYYYDDGYIKELAKDGSGDWYDGSFSEQGSTVGATVYQKGGTRIRVYVGRNNKVQEYIWDGDEWKEGSFNKRGKAADAVSWVDRGLHIRVYVQRSNNNLYQYKYDQSGNLAANAEEEEEFSGEQIEAGSSDEGENEADSGGDSDGGFGEGGQIGGD
jgi:hypothetical protein